MVSEWQQFGEDCGVPEFTADPLKKILTAHLEDWRRFWKAGGTVAQLAPMVGRVIERCLSGNKKFPDERALVVATAIVDRFEKGMPDETLAGRILERVVEPFDRRRPSDLFGDPHEEKPPSLTTGLFQAIRFRENQGDVRFFRTLNEAMSAATSWTEPWGEFDQVLLREYYGGQWWIYEGGECVSQSV